MKLKFALAGLVALGGAALASGFRFGCDAEWSVRHWRSRKC